MISGGSDSMSPPSAGNTDVYEKEGNVIYEMELPGVAKDDVKVTIDSGRLAVSGETRRSEEISRDDYFRIGRQYGRFRRTLPPPADVQDNSTISATLKDGMLKVSVPLRKSIRERAKPVEVRVE